MNELLMRVWGLGLICSLAWAAPAKAATQPEEEALPPPAPRAFSTPLPSHVLWASGVGNSTSLTHGAWVSSDGKRVAFFTREPSSAAGTTRTLVVKDVDTDAIVFEKELFSEEESLERSGPDLERLFRVRAREARASLEPREWKPLRYHALPHYDHEFMSEACYARQIRPKRSLSAEGLKLSYQAPRVQLWSRGRKVVDRRVPSWRVHQQGCEQASPAWLSGAFIGREEGVVLLELNFCGSHACSEPPAAFHVLRIPKAPRAGGASPGGAMMLAGFPSVQYEKAPYVSNHLYALGFPAVSEDGALVALAESFPDGARKDANLLLTVRRAGTGELVWSLPVLEAGEVSAVKGTLAQVEELDRKILGRLRQANASLAQTKWVPLEEQPLQPVVTESCQRAPVQTLKRPGLELSFHQGLLHLEQGHGKGPLTLKLAREDSTAEDPCTAPSRTFLDAAYLDEPRGVLLLRLSTCADESCPERNGWFHPLAFGSDSLGE
jgi:hypothetical protein